MDSCKPGLVRTECRMNCGWDDHKQYSARLHPNKYSGYKPKVKGDHPDAVAVVWRDSQRRTKAQRTRITVKVKLRNNYTIPCRNGCGALFRTTNKHTTENSHVELHLWWTQNETKMLGPSFGVVKARHTWREGI